MASPAPEPTLADPTSGPAEPPRERFSPRPRRAPRERLSAWVVTGPLGQLYGVGADVVQYGGKWLLGLLLARVREAGRDVAARLRTRAARGRARWRRR
jgi:hypothetical protein